MACIAYVGLPGSGKSHGVVENVIIPALKQDQKVFTNIPLKNEYCIEKYGSTAVYFDTQDIIDNADWWTDVFEAGSILVIDEAWRLWPAGMSINKARDQDKEFLAEHRHLVNQETGKSTNIFIVTQNLSQISNFVKILIDKTFRSVKLDAVGATKSYRVDVYQGEVSGANPPDTNKINSLYYKYKKEVFDSYVSHTKSDIAGDETSIDDRFNFIKSTKFKLLIFFLVVPFVLVFIGKSFIDDSIYSSGSSDSDFSSDSSNSPVSSDSFNSPGSEYSQGEVVKAKPRFKFLSSSDSVYISYNNGFYPFFDYMITVVNDQSYSSDFDVSQLMLLGYEVHPISSCAVRIVGDDFNSVVLCSKSDGSDRSGGVVERSVADTVM